MDLGSFNECRDSSVLSLKRFDSWRSKEVLDNCLGNPGNRNQEFLLMTKPMARLLEAVSAASTVAWRVVFVTSFPSFLKV